MPDELPLLDARQLRELGETADGARGDERVIVARKKDGRFSFDVLSEAQASDDPEVRSGAAKRVLRVQTSVKVRDRPAAKVVVTSADGKPADGLPPNADAVFLSESAAEKFLFPYYESVRIFEPKQLADLKKRFLDPRAGRYVIAIAHTPPSHPHDVTVSGSSIGLLVQAPGWAEPRWVWELQEFDRLLPPE